jgi:hypothetical protein
MHGPWSWTYIMTQAIVSVGDGAYKRRYVSIPYRPTRSLIDLQKALGISNQCHHDTVVPPVSTDHAKGIYV